MPGTAVVVFARAPGREPKRWGLGRRRNAAVARTLLGATVAAVRAGAGAAPVFVVGDGLDGIRAALRGRGGRFVGLPQRGEGFGARLRAALADVASRGFDRVAVVGTDTPGLSPADVRAAVRSRGGEAVLGPSADGGFYLLAIDVARLGVLDGLPWRTGSVAATLCARLDREGVPIRRRPVRADLDRPAQVLRARDLLEILCRRLFGLGLGDRARVPAARRAPAPPAPFAASFPGPPRAPPLAAPSA